MRLLPFVASAVHVQRGGRAFRAAAVVVKSVGVGERRNHLTDITVELRAQFGQFLGRQERGHDRESLAFEVGLQSVGLHVPIYSLN